MLDIGYSVDFNKELKRENVEKPIVYGQTYTK